MPAEDDPAEYHLTVSFVLNRDTWYEKRGYEISFTQFQLSARHALPAKPTRPAMPLSLNDENRAIVISGADFSYTFSQDNGLPTSIFFNGTELLAKGFAFNLNRAWLDNDRPDYAKFAEERFPFIQSRLAKLTLVESNETQVQLKASYVLAGYSVQPACAVEAVWTVTADGVLHCAMDVRQTRQTTITLPRFGFECFLREGLENVEWFGRGPTESYIDKRHAARFGRYHARVSDMTTHYVFPQENGSHAETRFAGVTDRRGLGLAILGDPEFSFSTHHYSTADFQDARHDHELKARKETVLNIDYRQQGIGSASCGPRLNAKYQLNAREFSFGFRLKPYFAEDTSLDSLY